MLGEARSRRRGEARLLLRLAWGVALLVLVSYVLFAMRTTSQQTRRRQAILDISRIEHAARLFRADHGRCPEGLEELVSPPDGPRYLTSTRDPWGQPYRLICPARLDPGGVQVFSGGPDRSFGGDDTISSI